MVNQVIFIMALLLPFQMITAQDLEGSQKTSVSYSERLSELDKRLERIHQDKESLTTEAKYNKVSVLWEDVAKNLKQHFVSYSDAEGVNRPWQEGVALRFQLLRKVSNEREQALQELALEGKSIFSVDSNTLRRIGVEIRIIPYKFLAYFYERWNWVKTRLSEGFVGALHVFLQLFFILLLALVPVVFFKVAKLVESKIEKQKKVSFYLSFRSQWHRNLTTGLTLLSEYLPWLFTLLALEVVDILLASSEFTELTYVTVYLSYYVYYKVFRVTLELVLREVASSSLVAPKEDINKKIRTTSRFLGLVLLTTYCVKMAFLSILGQSILFSIIEPFFGFIVLALLFFVSSRWELEIEHYLKQTNVFFLQAVARRMENRFSLFLSLPALVLVGIHFLLNRTVLWGSQFEFMKVVYAKVLRVKYETTKNDSLNMEKVDEDYVEKFFAASEQYRNPKVIDTDFYQDIVKQLDLWAADESTEQTVAIFGSRGCGKTRVLRELEAHYSEMGHECLAIDVTPKIFTEKGLDTIIEQVEKASKDENLIVFLDNAHNLFLSTVGGFSTYRVFLEKIEEMKNVFWVATYGDFSWQLLGSVVGKNQYFRIEQKVPRWTIEEIKNCILKTHEVVGRKLVYDEIFRSSQKLEEGVASAENRFFYLIWEKSGGIPGLAQSFWLRSLRRTHGESLKVCLPVENPISELSHLNQEMHFVYASIMKHENLNVSEAARATNLPRAIVKQAMFRGLEEGFLCEDHGRYRFTMDWYEDVKKYLKGKNLIYEF